MIVTAQTNDYGCGVFSLQFLLGLHGINASIIELEHVMRTTPEDGTSHEGIKKGMKHYGLKYVEWNNSHTSTLQEFLPAIINYQYCDEDGCDGHYAVVLGKSDSFFIIYNPATGEIEPITEAYLNKNWYSERYGKQWFIHLIENTNAHD